MKIQSKRLILVLSGMFSLLLIPFLTMQFSDDVNWNIFDFLVMGILLFGSGLLCELILSNVKSVKNRIVLNGAVLLVFLMIWIELAVGIISEGY